jgi:hypothetical protein
MMTTSASISCPAAHAAGATSSVENVWAKRRREMVNMIVFYAIMRERRGFPTLCNGGDHDLWRTRLPHARSGPVDRAENGLHPSGADRLEEMIEEEFAPAAGFPDKAWPWMAASILLSLATEENLVVGVDGAELLFPRFPALLRVRVVAPENRRTGNVMLDDRLDRPSARQQVKSRDTEARAQRRRALAGPRRRPSPST